MDEARAVVADFCEKNPYLLGALPMTWFGCGPFARMVVAGVIYELRLVITRGGEGGEGGDRGASRRP